MGEKQVEIPSQVMGIKPFPIQGRLIRERERLVGMTDAERKMRAQWVKDQLLSHREPVYVPAIEQELRNPIRRFYRFPLDKLFEALKPTLGSATPTFRYLTGKLGLALFFAYASIYYYKYNKNDWTTTSGWRMTPGRPRLYPGDKGYPYVNTMKPSDYNTRGFENSPI